MEKSNRVLFGEKIDDRVRKVLHILWYAKTNLIAIITQINWCNTFGYLNIWIGIHLFQSSFTLAFFALLRVSEVTAFTKEDIQILDTSMSVFIKNSKTDQHGSGASVWLPLTSVRVVLFILLKQFSLMSSQINKEVYFAHFNSKHDSVSIF